MKILVVTPFLWSGAGKAIVRIAGGLQSLGHRLEVVSSGESKGLTDWTCYVDELADEGIPYHKLDFFDRDPAVFWHSVKRLETIVHAFDPDLIHAHSGVAALGSLSASSLPVVTTLHSWNPTRPDWMNTMDLWALNHSNAVACVSSSYRDYLLSLGLRDDISRVIYPGVDSGSLRACAMEHATNPLESKKYFCYLGRLESRKRQQLLVDVLAAVREDWSLLLIGTEGERGYAQEVLDRARRLGVSHRLAWVGHMDNPYPLIRQSRCFVSASADEGLGLSLLEAMAIGVPVVAVAARGVTDFVRNGRTGLIAAGNAADIASKILYLEMNPAAAASMTSQSIAMVHTTFNWSKTIEKYESLFESVSQKRSRLEEINNGNDGTGRARSNQSVFAESYSQMVDMSYL